MKRLRIVAAVGLFAAVAGCSDGSNLVPVSGVVSISGKPYSKAVVSFQPVGTAQNPNPGRGSSAYTDENGKFVLMCDGTKKGALIGKHLVRIMTKGNNVVGIDPEMGSDDGGTAKKELDPIPPKWNAQSKEEFDVPPGGTDQANFDIINPKYKN